MNLRKKLESTAVDGRVSIDDAIIVAREAVSEAIEKITSNLPSDHEAWYCFECNRALPESSLSKGFDLTCPLCGKGVVYPPMLAIQEKVRRAAKQFMADFDAENGADHSGDGKGEK